MKTAKQILLDAADLMEKPGAWLQGSFSRNGENNFTDPRNQDAKCWCMLGGIEAVSDVPGTIAAINVLRPILGSAIISWNDAPERTQSEVVAKLREAAELA